VENFYLLDKLHDYPINQEILDIFKYELDTRIYTFGEQFKNSGDSRKSQKNLINIPYLYRKYKIIKGKVLRQNKADDSKKKIISNVYFSTNDKVRNMGYTIMTPPWGYSKDAFPIPDIQFLSLFYSFSKVLKNCKYCDLISDSFNQEYIRFKEAYKQVFLSNSVEGLFVPNDMNIWERISISIADQQKIPSFIFLHGLPGRYNEKDESRSTYLIVWGEQIKRNYVNAGHNPDRIFVSGHPWYNQLKRKELKNSLDNILVLTKSMGGAQIANDVILTDRGNMIYYLYSIQKVLQKLNINHVRFRPHPSENGLWYTNFIDNDFYQLDTESLSDSLNKSTLVIGPTSTVFLEAIYYGLNYIVYEPSVKDIGIDNYPLVPPFDGTDKRISVAKNEEDLFQMIKEKYIVDVHFWDDYITTPFDLSFIKKLV